MRFISLLATAIMAPGLTVQQRVLERFDPAGVSQGKSDVTVSGVDVASNDTVEVTVIVRPRD